MAVLVVVVMVGAYAYVHKAAGIYAADGGWELVAVIGLTVAVFGGTVPLVIASLQEADLSILFFVYVAVGAVRRWHRVQAAMEAGDDLPPTRMPLLLGCALAVLGLAVDYGVFMTEGHGGQAPRAVVLSAATTLAA